MCTGLRLPCIGRHLHPARRISAAVVAARLRRILRADRSTAGVEAHRTAVAAAGEARRPAVIANPETGF